VGREAEGLTAVTGVERFPKFYKDGRESLTAAFQQITGFADKAISQKVRLLGQQITEVTRSFTRSGL